MPRVLNRVRDPIPLDAIYVGRPSKWGNPFLIGRDGTRQEVCEKYLTHLYETGLIDQVSELKGKDLVCWCAPLQCHADILLRLANPELSYAA